MLSTQRHDLFISTPKQSFSPFKSTRCSAGMDLLASEISVLPPKQVCAVPTSARTIFPPGFAGLIKDKSSYALKGQAIVVAGVIDPDYTGDIFVLMLNHSDRELIIPKGTPFAQLVPVYTGFPQMHWISEDEFDFRVLATERGTHRFGQATEAYLGSDSNSQQSSGKIERLVHLFEGLNSSTDVSPLSENPIRINKSVKPPVPPKPKHLRAPLRTLYSSSDSSFESNTSAASFQSDRSSIGHRYFTRSKAHPFRSAHEPAFPILDETPSPDQK